MKRVRNCNISPESVDSIYIGCFGASGLEDDAGRLVEKAREWGGWEDFLRSEVNVKFVDDLIWMGFLLENEDGSLSFTVGFVKAVHDHTNFQ